TMNVQNPGNPLNAGLVARWGLDDGSGTSVADSVGTATGTIFGSGSSFVSGAPFDIAPCVDGSNRNVDLDGLTGATPRDYVLLEPLDLRGITPTKLGLTSFTI